MNILFLLSNYRFMFILLNTLVNYFKNKVYNERINKYIYSKDNSFDTNNINIVFII